VAFSGTTPVFFSQAGAGDGRSADSLFSFSGTATTGTWMRINPPGGTGGFGIFAVDRNNAQRLIASHIRPGNTPQMIMSTDGGVNWTNLAPLDALMTASGMFRYNTLLGPTDFLGFNGYPQPMLVAFDPENTNIIIAGGADSGVFMSFDGGTTWQLMTDPIDPVDSGRPHIPRPRHAYFDHEPWTVLDRTTTVGITTQGRGVWKLAINDHLDLTRFCTVNIRFCRRPTLDRGLIILDCGILRDCFIRDPVPRNCTIKYPCPGCTVGLCPPFYSFVFDGMDPEMWDVTLITSRGADVPHTVSRKGQRVVVSFRPTREMFRPGRIGNYELVFAPRTGMRPERTRVHASLQVGDKPFQADSPIPR
jgi:hypothetical protein